MECRIIHNMTSDLRDPLRLVLEEVPTNSDGKIHQSTVTVTTQLPMRMERPLVLGAKGQSTPCTDLETLADSTFLEG